MTEGIIKVLFNGVDGNRLGVSVVAVFYHLIAPVLPSGPTSLRPARGLKGLNTAPRALIHTGMGRSVSTVSGRSGKPQGSTSNMCFTLQTRVRYSHMLCGSSNVLLSHSDYIQQFLCLNTIQCVRFGGL